MKADYLKRIPDDGVAYLLRFDARYRPLGEPMRRIEATVLRARLLEARRLALAAQADFAEIWRKKDGAAALEALMVPEACLQMKELTPHTTFGPWLVNRSPLLGLGPRSVIALALLRKRSERAHERVAYLSDSASFKELSAIGYRPERGDDWWEADPGELVEGYTFECAGLEHRFYSCTKSWATRFRVRELGETAWTDLIGGPGPAATPAAGRRAARPRSRARRSAEGGPERSFEARLALEGRVDELRARLGASEALYQWLQVSASCGSTEAARALATFEEAEATRWGDGTLAVLHLEVARWFVRGEQTLDPDAALARAHLEQALRLDPSVASSAAALELAGLLDR